MAVISSTPSCLSYAFYVRFCSLLALLLLIFNIVRLHHSAFHRTLSPVAVQPLSGHSVLRPVEPAREIFLQPSAVKIEGIGAVLSGLKPVLLLSQYTNARITMHDNFTGHGYNMSQYLQFGTPFPPWQRVPCNITFNMRKLLVRIVEQCEHFNLSELHQLRLFDKCNSISISKYIAHPRVCLKHTQNLVRSFTKFRNIDDTPKNHVCVLRRGGDIEHIILAGEGNKYAIDEQLTLPILHNVSRRGGKVALITETEHEQQLKALYKPHVFSNFDSLERVVSLLGRCRCTFVSSGSSFAAAMMQITRPSYIVYTSSREGFSFEERWYSFEEYGPSAIDVNSAPQHVVDKCAPRW
ncbi:unnamed protein product [Agarophyton chilense]|eukprot:gb/GEZJ01005812.1/.p1 GENE.gb/GEZJ01005812.1/~~gb/GEZJ01005812.1/.p1  ORF type:complete len:352 (-),score=41.20 gb/GEZJ01005812.1/:119-1174(-)